MNQEQRKSERLNLEVPPLRYSPEFRTRGNIWRTPDPGRTPTTPLRRVHNSVDRALLHRQEEHVSEVSAMHNIPATKSTNARSQASRASHHSKAVSEVSVTEDMAKLEDEEEEIKLQLELDKLDLEDLVEDFQLKTEELKKENLSDDVKSQIADDLTKMEATLKLKRRQFREFELWVTTKLKSIDRKKEIVRMKTDLILEEVASTSVGSLPEVIESVADWVQDQSVVAEEQRRHHQKLEEAKARSQKAEELKAEANRQAELAKADLLDLEQESKFQPNVNPKRSVSFPQHSYDPIEYNSEPNPAEASGYSPPTHRPEHSQYSVNSHSVTHRQTNPFINEEYQTNFQETQHSDIGKLAQAITSAITSTKSNPDNNELQKMLNRQAAEKELPYFWGDPSDWLLFITTFQDSTESCGFNDTSNLARLKKCLKGKALAVVKPLLLAPSNVAKIIHILELNFGRPTTIIKVMMDKARQTPSIKEGRPETIIEFSNIVEGLVTNIVTLNKSAYLQNPQLLEELLHKLPPNERIQWGRVMEQKKGEVDLTDFSHFVSEMAVAASYIHNPISQVSQDNQQQQNHNPQRRQKQDGQRAERVFAATDSPKKDTGCLYCGHDHKLRECRKFQAANLDDRWKLVRDKKICFSCLGLGHAAAICKKKKDCGKDGCKGYHHPSLHRERETKLKDQAPQQKPEIPTENVNQVDEANLVATVASGACTSPSTLPKYHPVVLRGPGGIIKAFAFDDDGSSPTLLEQPNAKLLGLKGTHKPLFLTFLNSEIQHEPDSEEVNLEIRGDYPGAPWYYLKGVKTVTKLNLPSMSIDPDAMAEKWKHLDSSLIPKMDNVKPTLLIGLDNLPLIVAREVKPAPYRAPHQIRTKLGWMLAGKNNNINSTPSSSFSFHICEEADQALHQMVKDNFAIESFGAKALEDKPESKEEKRAMSLMNENTKRIGKRYETGLLWKMDKIELPDSYATAMNRLICLERKLSKDQVNQQKFIEKIKYYEDKQYIRKLTLEEAAVKGPKTWYLPPFFAFNPNKPGKPRLVFDAKSKAHGVSLNDMLSTGPDLLNPLPSVLLKFRQKQYAFSGDIKEMFHQVKIKDEDVNSQRFLWRDMETTREPDTYVLQVMSFGAACSPTLAQYVKNKNADDFKEEFPEAYLAITKHHYVDDYLGSSDTIDQSNKLIRDVIHVHSQGGFEICNWTANSREILQQIPEVLRSSEVKELNLESELPTGRVLGLWWNSELDVFTFSLSLSRIPDEIKDGSKVPTKRETLRLVMSLYDPLGFLGHFIIKAKIILQSIWRSQIGWDDEIPMEFYKSWKMWIAELHQIPNIQIPRCYSYYFSSSSNIQLHVFCDASQQAYCAVAYLRTETLDYRYETAFVMSKTRVAPLKPMTIPRLELLAAVTGSRLAQTIISELEVTIHEVIFWSDSSTVLKWIRSDANRYKAFVAHRVGEIEDLTNPDQWRWIPTKMNVADDATRENFPTDLSSNSRWLCGPNFLLEPPEQWPIELKEIHVVEDDAELEARPMFANFISEPIPILLPDIKKYSSWMRLIRTTAWMRRLIRRKKSVPTGGRAFELIPEEIQAAEKVWWKKVQEDSFPSEIQSLKMKVPINRNSPLAQLTPYLDEDGIIRMYGRLDRCNLVDEFGKRPVILCAKHPYTELMIQFYHQKGNHRGKEMVVNEIRKKYWIPRLKNAVKKIFNRCRHCKHQKTKPVIPIMGQLPSGRVNPVYPFSFTGADYFGPYEVTVGRHREKRYGVVFTCLTTRAVHIELATNLTTDSAIMAIRRMIARRGQPLEMFSDNGTNLVGAEKEMREALAGLDQNEIQQNLTTAGIKWNFNPPAAPHMGGIWERDVRSVKTALKETLKEQAPSEETLRTLLSEAEAIVNARPLTTCSDDPECPVALTPNDFLIGRQCANPAPGEFDRRDGFLRVLWKKCQRLTEIFWDRWVKEYLPTLNRRQKWREEVTPVKVTDIVLLMNENPRRNEWHLGRIVAVYPGKDGKIRTVDVRTAHGLYRRPVAKVCKLDTDPEQTEIDVISPTATPGQQVTESNPGSISGPSIPIPLSSDYVDTIERTKLPQIPDTLARKFNLRSTPQIIQDMKKSGEYQKILSEYRKWRSYKKRIQTEDKIDPTTEIE